MNIFTIYNLQTGEIEHSTSTVAQINEVGLLEGQGIIEGDYQPNEYKVVSGEAIQRTDNILEILRNKRNALLKESDWTQLNDCPLSDTKKTEWQTYRQALRDLLAGHQDTDNIDEVAFPNLPQ
jgi:hypothetical protein